MDATVIAGLAAIVGLVLGRFWDSRSETARWRRDQRIRTYEQVGGSYYALREAIRVLAMLEPSSESTPEVASRALDLGVEFNRAIVAVWLHGSGPVAAAVREIDREVIKMFLAAREHRFSWEEWRDVRAPAEHALERFIEAVRSELSLPQLDVAIRIADIARPASDA